MNNSSNKICKRGKDTNNDNVEIKRTKRGLNEVSDVLGSSVSEQWSSKQTKLTKGRSNLAVNSNNLNVKKPSRVSKPNRLGRNVEIEEGNNNETIISQQERSLAEEIDEIDAQFENEFNDEVEEFNEELTTPDGIQMRLNADEDQEFPEQEDRYDSVDQEKVDCEVDDDISEVTFRMPTRKIVIDKRVEDMTPEELLDRNPALKKI